MRNEWFPKNKAEYMTPTRFQELGLTRDAIGEVDRSFVVLSALDAAIRSKPEEPEMEEPVPEVPVSQVKVPDVTVMTFPPLLLSFPFFPPQSSHPVLVGGSMAQTVGANSCDCKQPETAHALLFQLIPNTLTFHRKPVPVPKPKTTQEPKVSPLIARHVPASTPTTRFTEIFGSVSSSDIFNQIKALIADHEEASRINLAPSSVKILGLDKDNDRIKYLGRWDIEIAVARAKSGVEPVRKSVEILPSAQ